MDAKDLLWVLPLGLGVIYTVDKIGGMGERFEGLGSDMKTHVRLSKLELRAGISNAKGAIKEANKGNCTKARFYHRDAVSSFSAGYTHMGAMRNYGWREMNRSGILPLHSKATAITSMMDETIANACPC